MPKPGLGKTISKKKQKKYSTFSWLGWWGRWDLNPGSHAPQACILIHARRRPHGDTCFLKELNETEQAIIKTLTFLKQCQDQELNLSDYK